MTYRVLRLKRGSLSAQKGTNNLYPPTEVEYRQYQLFKSQWNVIKYETTQGQRTGGRNEAIW